MSTHAALDLTACKKPAYAPVDPAMGGRVAPGPLRSSRSSQAARLCRESFKHCQETRMKINEFKALRARQEALSVRVSKLVNAYTRDDLEDEEGRLLLALMTARRLSEDLLVGLMEEAAELETLRLVSRAKSRGEPPKVR